MREKNIKEIKKDCDTCKHEISPICLDCDIKDKSKGWEPKTPILNKEIVL